MSRRRTWRDDKTNILAAARTGALWAVAEDLRRQQHHDTRRETEKDHDMSSCWCCCWTCVDGETEETK